MKNRKLVLEKNINAIESGKVWKKEMPFSHQVFWLNLYIQTGNMEILILESFLNMEVFDGYKKYSGFSVRLCRRSDPESKGKIFMFAHVICFFILTTPHA